MELLKISPLKIMILTKILMSESRLVEIQYDANVAKETLVDALTLKVTKVRDLELA